MIIFWPPEFLTLTQPGRIDVAHDTLVCNDNMFHPRISWKVSLRGHILPLWLSQVVKIACVVSWTSHNLAPLSMGASLCICPGTRAICSVLLYLLTTVLISQTSCLKCAIKYDAQHLKLFQNSFSPHYGTHKVHHHKWTTLHLAHLCFWKATSCLLPLLNSAMCSGLCD